MKLYQWTEWKGHSKIAETLRCWRTQSPSLALAMSFKTLYPSQRRKWCPSSGCFPPKYLCSRQGPLTSWETCLNWHPLKLLWIWNSLSSPLVLPDPYNFLYRLLMRKMAVWHLFFARITAVDGDLLPIFRLNLTLLLQVSPGVSELLQRQRKPFGLSLCLMLSR